ncbi:putative DoxX family protein [uncultured Alphaproteobacteria bacterium]|uniref:Putative DoxX family protein n=1 Tax=uncultured Alphaproteobacteria bacterium TaxID=91750 RepID=A0A212KLS0_9PROT|nr:putative DoxX family protein [uncultured Alphaproteobacteria bacterium]
MESASTPRATSGDVFLMVSRVGLGFVFLYAGALKGFDLAGATAEIQALGVPFARPAAAFAALIQIVGGSGVILGWRVGAAATALAVLTAAAILAGHSGWMLDFPGAPALPHALVTGGFAALALHGPGRLSFDAAATRPG